MALDAKRDALIEIVDLEEGHISRSPSLVLGDSNNSS
jgi:hypothetical protein